MHAALIFPHQLFTPDTHPALAEADAVYLVEHDRFFRGLTYHTHKLVLHRASLYAYYDELDGRRYTKRYVATEDGVDSNSLFRRLADDGIEQVSFAEVHDHTLYADLKQAADTCRITIVTQESPYFLTPRSWCDEWCQHHERYRMHSFYIARRKAMEILLTADGSPQGGQWSFDEQNRKAFDPSVEIPDLYSLSGHSYVSRAIREIKTLFPHHPGDPDDFYLPTTRAEAGRWLGDFFRRKFYRFGPYQDAIARNETFLFHSVISPVLNTGLLTPREVVDRAIDYADEHDVPISSLEGFIRQIIGWREFMAMIYEREHETEVSTNFFKHGRRVPDAFYTAETGLPPVDGAIRRVRRYGYTHHIERLMVLGNIMVLLRVDPNEVYRWFMELFVDAYDWVMVPNVYGMSQFADGGLFATKPYISSSNYIRKMSDYEAGEWCDVWDSLYWTFVYDHRSLFDSNPRLAMMASHLDPMTPAEKRERRRRANEFIDTLYGSV